MALKKTENCVMCLKPACYWTGHVAKGDEKVLAGFCSEQCEKKGSHIVSPTGAGCLGQWHDGLGALLESR